MAQFPGPLFYVIMILASIVLGGVVIYRYLYNGWTRAQTTVMLGVAGGGIGYAIVEADALFELLQIVAKIILLFAAITFIGGGVYILYSHLRADVATG